MEVVILCSDEAHHRYLVATLQSRFTVVAVVEEPAASRRQRLLRSKRYGDFAYAMYHHLRRAALGLDAYRQRYFAYTGDPCDSSPARRLIVPWINDARVAELLREVVPDVTVVMGTSILRRAVLSAAGPLILNIHGGWLPDYRGNHCFFFPLYHCDFDHIASTIHFIDGGIDTGDIVERVVPPIYPDDSAETLYCRSEKLAIHRLVEWLTYYERGGVLPRQPQDQRGTLYRTRDRTPYHDVVYWLRRKTGRLRLPAPGNGSGEFLHTCRPIERPDILRRSEVARSARVAREKGEGC